MLKQSRAVLAWLAIAALGLGTCGEGPRGGLQFIQDDQFAIRDPGGAGSAATGIGCGLDDNEALFEARRTAHYNLRGMLGPGRYAVHFETLRRFRDAERHCAEVEARVAP
jgi:hypothetical protein